MDPLGSKALALIAGLAVARRPADNRTSLQAVLVSSTAKSSTKESHATSCT